MNNTELQESGFPPIWDNTMRQLAVACPRKLYYFLRGFDYDPSTKPAYFVWGSAWEEIMATWYSASQDILQDPVKRATHAYLSLQMGYQVWDEMNPIEKTLNKRSSFEPIWNAYLDQYPYETWHMIERGAEAGWTFPLVGTPYSLGGAFDGVIEVHEPLHGLMALENKTTGAFITKNYIDSWHFAPQVTGYIWYGRKILGDQFIGALMNLVTKNLPGPRSQWTTPRFARVVVTKTDHQLAEFEEQAAWHINLIKREHWDRWYWPKTLNKDDCCGGIGKAPCLFRPLCFSDVNPADVNHTDCPGVSLREGPWQPWLRWGSQDEE